jgi:hypothetical protein
MEQQSPKHVFLNLFSIIALYISAGALVALVFQFINLAFPDALNPYEAQGAYGIMRWAIASLVIVFPACMFAMRALQRSYAANPAIAEMRSRKWLTYFTLFAAGVLMAGDLVTLVYTLLSGDITMRFVLKALAVLMVAGAVFGYYRADLQKNA